MKTDIQKTTTTNQIQSNVAVKRRFLQSLSIKELDGISGGPTDEMCPYCEIDTN